MDIQQRIARLRAHYPDIVSFNKFSMEKLAMVYPQVSGVDDFAIIQYSEDLLNYVGTALVIKRGRFESYLFINAYELIDIYLGLRDDLRRLYDITVMTVIVYLGYNEFENRRQSDVMEQLFQIQRVAKRRFIILYKGRDFAGKYPATASLFREYSYPIISIDSGAKSPVARGGIL